GSGRVPAHLGASLARPDEPAGDLDERRFSGAVRPEQAGGVALPPFQAEAGERLDSAVALAETEGAKRGHPASVRASEKTTCSSAVGQLPFRCHRWAWKAAIQRPASRRSRPKKSSGARSTSRPSA